jgi:hypothetical protein
VTTQQVERYVDENAGIPTQKMFDQYLRTTQIPDFEYYFSDDHKKVFYRWSNCIEGFNFPLTLRNDQSRLRIFPTPEWKSTDLKGDEAALFDKAAIEKMYYIGVKPKT